MGDAIISLADSARRDVSAQKAIERAERGHQGPGRRPAARATPLPVARNHLAAAKRELDEIDRVRAGGCRRRRGPGRRERGRHARSRSRSRGTAICFAAPKSPRSGGAHQPSRPVLMNSRAAHRSSSTRRAPSRTSRSTNETTSSGPGTPFASYGSVWWSEQAETERQRRRLEELNERRESLSSASGISPASVSTPPNGSRTSRRSLSTGATPRRFTARPSRARRPLRLAADPLRDEYDALAADVHSLSPATSAAGRAN